MAIGKVYENGAGWRNFAAADIPASGVTPGIYGDGTHVGQVTVDAAGRVTAATDVAITGGGGGGTIEVTDGTHTVAAATEVDFTSGATVTDAGGGVAQVAITGGGGGGGGTLAVVQYAPAVLVAYNVTNAAGLTALDTTHLTVSFTVPASGNVLVYFSALVVSPAGLNLGVGLLNHSGGAQLGFTLSNFTTVSTPMYLAAGWYLTGLSAGSLGIDIAAGVSGGTGTIYAQGKTGAVTNGAVSPALIVVNSA